MKAIEKAESILAQADKKSTSITMPWNKERVREEILELIVDAAGQYKIAKDWTNAAETYTNAAKQCETMKEMYDACTHYVNAAVAYKHISPPDAIKSYTRACEIHRDGDRGSPAGKLYKEIALIHEKAKNKKGALEAYSNAADSFEESGQGGISNQMRLRVADLTAQTEEYEKAKEIYEALASGSSDNRMAKYTVNEYFFKSALCSFIIFKKKKDDPDEVAADVQELLNGYKDMFPSFDDSREYKLLNQAREAFGDEDEDLLAEEVEKYNNRGKMDATATFLFSVIEELIIGDNTGDPAAKSKDGIENDDDDDLGVR